MKVLMLGWEYPPQITGGLGTACYGITKSLAKQNVDVLFVVPKAFGNEDTRYARIQDAGEIPSRYLSDDPKGYWGKIFYKEVLARLVPYTTPEDYKKKLEKEVMRLVNPGNSGDADFIPFTGSYGTDLWKEIERFSKVTSLLAGNEKYDIIHAHEWLTFPAAIEAKKISKKPLVVHIHATEFDRSGIRINREIYNIEKRGMIESDKVITVSNYTRDVVIKFYGIEPEKVVAVHNAIEIDPEEPEREPDKPGKEKIVTFLGRITFQKGPEYFIDAAYMVLKKFGNVRFVMAGSGDCLDKILRQVDALGISSKVMFPGFLNNAEVNRLLSRTDIFVMPSVSEPFGISPLEALRSGVPVIISKQSGVSEIIKNAIKIDHWDINAISDAISGVLSYGALSSLLSTEGKKEVSRLNWDKTGKQILDVYKLLV